MFFMRNTSETMFMLLLISKFGSSLVEKTLNVELVFSYLRSTPIANYTRDIYLSS